MRKLLYLLMTFLICWLISPPFAQADVGPKPTLTVIAKNLPDEPCYLDLLIDTPPEGMYNNLPDSQKYNSRMLNKLKQYRVKGWRPAMVTGTMPPMFGDIICQVHQGVATLHFSYLGVPDQFKIIVVSTDGKTVVSNLVQRTAFNSTVQFDYHTGKATENSLFWAYLRQFILTYSATIVIEGLILLFFGFSWRQNWRPFVVINLLTQVLLTLVFFQPCIKLEHF